MPRCQWCRQESQDPNVCDWCKRPLTAGWTPAAAAIPADRMSFAATQGDEPTSDRLLMFSVVGIVVIVGAAFAMSMFSHKQPLPAVQPPAPPVIQPQTPPAQDTQVAQPAPMPASVPVESTPAPVYTPPPTYVAPTYDPPVSHGDETTVRATGNRKLDSLRDITGQN